MRLQELISTFLHDMVTSFKSIISSMDLSVFTRVAKDNIASFRVLEKCGFVVTGEGSGFANARHGIVEEYVMTLVRL